MPLFAAPTTTTIKEHSSTTVPASLSLAVTEFSNAVQQACESKSLTSLTVQGVSSKPPKGVDILEYKQELRGQIRVVNGRLVALSPKKKKKHQKQQSLSSEEPQVVLQMTFKYHGSTDIVKNWIIEENNVIGEEVQTLLTGTDSGTVSGELKSSEGNYKLTKHKKSNEWMCKQTFSSGNAKESQSQSSKEALATTIAQHDRPKQVLIGKNEEQYLQLLGITNAQGDTKVGMQSKLKQCQKFVEIVSKLVDNLVEKKDGGESKSSSNISVIDMGCGRGYLTFSLHHYLSQLYHSDGESPTTASVSSTGVELRPALVDQTNSFCLELGAPFDTLTFVEGSIDTYLKDDENKQEEQRDGANNDNNKSPQDISVLIALHACDTATDDALLFGITNGANLIVTAPCCHKQIRRQLDTHYVKLRQSHPLKDILRFPIYRERHSETVTDSIRALLLEMAHYNVKVFEFISSDHTGKNVMITATKRKRKRSSKEIGELQTRLIELCELHGIHTQTLAQRMGIHLSLNNVDEDETSSTNVNGASKSPPKNRGRPAMVPLPVDE